MSLGLESDDVDGVLGWLLAGALALATATHSIAGDLLWAGLGAAVLAVALLPPAVAARPTAMVTWEVLAVAALPVGVHALGLAGDWLASVTVPALALVVAVDLDALTAVQMSAEFAVAFVVVVTMALAGLWTVAGFVSDAVLGTTVLGDQTEVMWDLVATTGVGVLAGGLFELYVRRRASVRHLTTDAGGDGP